MQPLFDEFARAEATVDRVAAAASDREELAAEVRAVFQATTSLQDRLAGAVGGPIKLHLNACPDIEGRLMRVGRDHLWVADRHGHWIVRTAALDGVSGLRPQMVTAVPRSPIGPMSLASALRELVGVDRDVSALVGERWISGRLRVVGADYLELEDVSVPLERVRACRVRY